MARPLKPLEAITRYIGEGICEHEKQVNDTIEKINLHLPGMFCDAPGDDNSVEVVLSNITTQAAFLEVVLQLREQGWKVTYSENCPPSITISIPAK
jgi:hypothetical protein